MKKQKLIKFLLIGFLAGGYFLWLCRLGSIYSADVRSALADRALDNADPKRAVSFADKAILLNPKEPAYYRRRAKAITLYSVFASPEELPFLKDMVYEDLKTAEGLNPKNLATLRNIIPLYYYLALERPKSTGESPAGIDPKYLDITKCYYNKLKDTYLNDLGILVSIAHYENLLGLSEEHDRTIKMIRALRPDVLNWHPLLK